MRCDVPDCATTAIRTQAYQIRGNPRVHLCVDHWLIADNSPLALHKLVGIPERGADPEGLAKPRDGRG